MRRWFLGALGVAGSALACDTDPPALIVPESDVPARHAPAIDRVGGSLPAVVPAVIPEDDASAAGSSNGNGSGGAKYENIGGSRNVAGSGGSAGAAGSANNEPAASDEQRYALMQAVTPGSPP